MAAKLTCGGKSGGQCASGLEYLKAPRVDWNYREEWEEAEGKGLGICIPKGSLVVKEPWNGWGV